MVTRSLIVLTIFVIALLVLSCEWLSTKRYNVDRLSPNGTYRVKVAVAVKDEGDISGHFTDQGSIKVLKGSETVYAEDWNYRDNWDPSFIERNPVIEWVEDNVLRMGGDKSGQPFTNELIISNDTEEHLKHIGVSCGKYETFKVFDIGPRSTVVLHPSPGLHSDVSGDFSVGYGGVTLSGKAFSGALQQKQPNSSLKLQIRVSPQDLP
jgi:hypothetical protein